jgi:phosphatidylglycerol---prolipoprotein diacylglyceryl transferase
LQFLADRFIINNMLVYPNMNPIALQLGPIQIYWYGIMYLLAFIMAWGLALIRLRKPYNKTWSRHEVADLIFYAAIGVIVGGRLGYVLFYATSKLWHDPWLILKIWQGGMSFHGGLLGVACALLLFARKTGKFFFTVTDFLVPLAPLGLAAGRLGNFINQELVGRVTQMPWGMLYPQGGILPRHPSELYELFFEGLVLFVIVWFYSNKARPRMAVTAMFLLSYAIFRFMLEFFRQPDLQLGFIAFGWLTMGQLLSLPMLMLGIILLWRANHD